MRSRLVYTILASLAVAGTIVFLVLRDDQCPSCGVTFHIKQERFFAYGEVAEEQYASSIKTSPDIKIINVSRGIGVCNDCLTTPERFNPDRILETFRGYGWDKEGLAKLERSAQLYKKHLLEVSKEE